MCRKTHLARNRVVVQGSNMLISCSPVVYLNRWEEKSWRRVSGFDVPFGIIFFKELA